LQILVWAPHLQFPYTPICCQHCDASELGLDIGSEPNCQIKLKGWAKPRLIYGLNDRKILIFRTYTCLKCYKVRQNELAIIHGNVNQHTSKRSSESDQAYKQRKKAKIAEKIKENPLSPYFISSIHPAFLRKLPMHVLLAFPYIISKRAGIEISLMKLLESSIENATGITSFRNILYENYNRTYDEKQCSFLSAVGTLIMFANSSACVQSTLTNNNSALGTTLRNLKDKNYCKSIPKFSKFKDRYGYFGQVPSGKSYEYRISYHR